MEKRKCRQCGEELFDSHVHTCPPIYEEALQQWSHEGEDFRVIKNIDGYEITQFWCPSGDRHTPGHWARCSDQGTRPCILGVGDGKTTDVGLPTDPTARKAVPIFSGVIRYFPDALAAIAELSKIGNDQHNPGDPLHWAREKSGDELDAATRHLIEAGTIDTDGVRHSTKLAWRTLANLQKELEIAAGIDPNVTRGT